MDLNFLCTYYTVLFESSFQPYTQKHTRYVRSFFLILFLESPFLSLQFSFIFIPSIHRDRERKCPRTRFGFGSPIPHRSVPYILLSPPKMIAIPYLTALTTYFSYGLLFAFGQFRDFFRKIFDWCSSNNLQVRSCPSFFPISFYFLDTTE